MAELVGTWIAAVRKGLIVFLVSACCLGGMSVGAYADEKGEVIKQFVERQADQHSVKAIPDKKRHQILFVMGILLLIGIISTAGLGIAMALFGKEVFVAHMVSAGFSVFLAVAHAVTAIVWFFPF